MLCRLGWGISLLAWALLLVDVRLMLLLLLASMLTLLCRGAALVLFWRSFKLLLWLFVPVIVFHGLFSPGVYVQTPFPMPLTIEGLHRAVFLSLHLVLMFFSALACFRILSYSEWLKCLFFIPILGEKFTPYLLLFSPLRQASVDILRQQSLQWKNEGKKWLSLPDLCANGIDRMIVAGQAEATSLWHDWEARVDVLLQSQQVLPTSWRDMAYMNFVVVGWGLFWINTRLMT